jgi:hypothetical protein
LLLPAGRTALRRGDYPLARTLFERASQEPAATEARYLASLAYFALGQYGAAEDLLRGVLRDRLPGEREAASPAHSFASPEEFAALLGRLQDFLAVRDELGVGRLLDAALRLLSGDGSGARRSLEILAARHPGEPLLPLLRQGLGGPRPGLR